MSRDLLVKFCAACLVPVLIVLPLSVPYFQVQREYGLDYTILRFGTLFGRRADDTNSVHRYLRQALEERRIVAYGTGDELREYIHEKLKSSGISRVDIERAANKCKINVHTARPGIVIGKKGAGIGSLVGLGSSALYTYKLRRRSPRRY